MQGHRPRLSCGKPLPRDFSRVPRGTAVWPVFSSYTRLEERAGLNPVPTGTALVLLL